MNTCGGSCCPFQHCTIVCDFYSSADAFECLNAFPLMHYILKVAFPLDSGSVLKTGSRFHVRLAFKMWTITVSLHFYQLNLTKKTQLLSEVHRLYTVHCKRNKNGMFLMK